MSHYEFTGEPRDGLRQIRALRDLPQHGVKAGDVGGWIESERNLTGDAWVSDAARVYGAAQVYGAAWVSGAAQVYGAARVSGAARVYGRQHVLVAGPIGSESVIATLWRTETGHQLAVGCWLGTLDTLAAEVEQRSGDWDADEATAARWRAEYLALETLGRIRVAGWAVAR